MQFFRLYLPVAALLCLLLQETIAQQTHITLQSAARFDGDFAPVVHQGRKVFLHRSGRIVADKLEESIRNGGNVVRKAGYAGVIDSTGRVVLPFEYDEIEEDDLHFFRLKKNGKYGLADSTGRVLAAPAYNRLDGLYEGAVAFTRGAQYGWLSLKDGSVHPSPYPLSKSYIHPQLFKQENGELSGLLHENGAQVAPVKYAAFRICYPGTFVYIEGSKAGMMGLDGKIITQPLYDQLDWSADDSLVRARQGGKTGLISPEGVLTIPVQYNELKMFTAGQAVAVRNGKYGVVSMNGGETVPLQYDNITPLNALGHEILNYAVKEKLTDTFRAYRVEKQGKYGLVAWNGKELLPPVYEEVAIATLNGRAYVFAQKAGKTGLYSQAGKEIIPPRYEQLLPAGKSNAGFTYYATDAAMPFAEQMVRAVNGKYNGFFSLDGRELVPLRYEEVRWESNGLLLLKNGDTTTIADATGRIVRPPAYRRYYYAVATDRLVEAGDGGYRLTDLAGRELYRWESWSLREVQNAVGDSSCFYSGLMKTGGYENQNLFIDRNGKEVRFSAFTRVEPFYMGLAVAFKNNKVGFIDSLGREVIPVKYDDIRNLADRSNEYKKVRLNDRYGVISRTGKTLLPPEYDNITPAGDGYFIFSLNNKAGLADSTGKICLPPEYDQLDMNTTLHCLTLWKGRKRGLAHTDGKIIIPAEYDELNPNYGWNAHGWPVMARKGNTVHYFTQNGEALPVTATTE